MLIRTFRFLAIRLKRAQARELDRGFSNIPVPTLVVPESNDWSPARQTGVGLAVEGVGLAVEGCVGGGRIGIVNMSCLCNLEESVVLR